MKIKSQVLYNRYLKFIHYCKTSKKGDYTENHHIIPLSMGGCDDDNNTIRLSAREHFIAHHLLWRAFRNKETNFAFWSMQMGKLKYNSITYALLKEEHSKLQSERIKLNNPMMGDISRQKVSKSHKGMKASEETKNKMSIKRKGVKKSEQTKRNMSLASLGKPKSDSHKKNLSLNHYDCSGKNNPMFGRSAAKEKNLKWYTNGVNNKFITEGTEPESWYRGRTIRVR